MAMSKKKKAFYTVLVVGAIGVLGWSLYPKEQDYNWVNNNTNEPVNNNVNANQTNGASQVIRKANPTHASVSQTAEQMVPTLVNMSADRDEARQHKEKGLSLRNEKLMKQIATTRKERLSAELDALKTAKQIEQLNSEGKDKKAELSVSTGADMGEPTKNQASSPPSPERELSEAQRKVLQESFVPLEQYYVKGIFKSNGELVARITRGGSIEKVKSGYLLDGEVNVEVNENSVTFTRGKKTVTKYF
ncbi:hypothetical protein [Idiomarina abyssalis]|uniref:Uncharacterized protein n=1 Tax=Idiomarina abyssalis TaxID=86102 RepID=A0A8I1GEV7_9GAMM|nr:hypothetical protein [Idiomarina abyssalis]MBJ7265588.1 hypothetical protein [Idiomarina abyssalis]MBJ7316738.1 hypothetical protein [Idiomarina abyssalis]